MTQGLYDSCAFQVLGRPITRKGHRPGQRHAREELISLSVSPKSRLACFIWTQIDLHVEGTMPKSGLQLLRFFKTKDRQRFLRQWPDLTLFARLRRRKSSPNSHCQQHSSDTDNKNSQRDISKREGMFAVTAHRQNLRGSYPRKYSVPPTRGPPTGPA